MRTSSLSSVPSRTDRTSSRKRFVSQLGRYKSLSFVHKALFCAKYRVLYFYCCSFLVALQGMITLVLECVDRLNVYNTAAHFSEYAGEEAAESWKEIVNLLYELLGRPIRPFFMRLARILDFFLCGLDVLTLCACLTLSSVFDQR